MLTESQESARKYVQFYPTDLYSPYPSIGDHRINTGIFVHSIIGNPPPPASYVKCNVEDLTLDSFLATWGRASGISPEPGSTKVVQISPEQYVELWGAMGEEQASQWKFFRVMHDLGLGLDKVPGVNFLDAQELMTEDAKSELVNTEESIRGMDWSFLGFEVKGEVNGGSNL